MAVVRYAVLEARLEQPHSEIIGRNDRYTLKYTSTSGKYSHLNLPEARDLVLTLNAKQSGCIPTNASQDINQTNVFSKPASFWNDWLQWLPKIWKNFLMAATIQRARWPTIKKAQSGFWFGWASCSSGRCSGPSTLINVVGKRNLNGINVYLRWRSERDTLDQRWSTFMVLNKTHVEHEAQPNQRKLGPGYNRAFGFHYNAHTKNVKTFPDSSLILK